MFFQYLWLLMNISGFILQQNCMQILDPLSEIWRALIELILILLSLSVLKYLLVYHNLFSV